MDRILRILRFRVRWWMLVVGYVVFFLMGGCASKLILFPSRHAMSAAGAQRREIGFEGKAGGLEVFVARSREAATRPVEGYVVRFLGNAERAEMSAGRVLEWDFVGKSVEVWTVQHPGFGNSAGSASLGRLGPAALAAFDAVAQEANGRPVFISATSLGTTMALHVGANRGEKVAGMVLRTPPPLQNMILTRHGWWNLYLLALPVAFGVPSDLNALRTAPRCKAPAVFVLIRTDEVVPYAYQEKVATAYAGEKTLVISQTGDHNSPLTDSVYRQVSVEVDRLWDRAVGRSE